MVMLVFWGASSPHFSDQKVVQHQTAIYQRAIFLNSTIFLWQFLKFWYPQQKYGGISLGSCVGWDFCYSSKRSGRLEIQLESFHQLYNTRSQSLQFLGFVWRVSSSTFSHWNSPIRGDESGFIVDGGEFFPCFFCWEILLMDEILHHLGWLKPYK